MNPSDKKWEKFEEFVASIQKRLTPHARVIHNEKIIGKSGTPRQIDIAVRYKLGQFDVLVIIDCKDWSKPVDIADVGAFIDMVEDVSANKGAIICNAGFTDGAKNRALEKGIDLFRVIDAKNIDWPVYIGFPTLCDFRYIKFFNFCFRHSAPSPFMIPAGDLRYLEIYKGDHSFNDILINLLTKSWNAGKLPQEVGRFMNLKFIVEDSYTRVGDNFYGPVEIIAGLEVDRKLFFGSIPLLRGQGFANEVTRQFTTNSIEFGLDVAEVEQKWRRIIDEKELAVRPTFTFHASDCYPIIEYKPRLTHSEDD